MSSPAEYLGEPEIAELVAARFRNVDLRLATLMPGRLGRRGV